MHAPPVNIDKSIRWKRLWFIPSVETFFTYLFWYAMGLLLAVAFISPIFNDKIAHSPISVGLASLFSLWMLSNLFLLNKLTSKKADIADLKIILDNRYGLDIQIKEKLIRSIKPTTYSRMGRAITIIIDGDKIYMNITTLLPKAGGPSPLHGLVNYLRCRQILWKARS